MDVTSYIRRNLESTLQSKWCRLRWAPRKVGQTETERTRATHTNMAQERTTNLLFCIVNWTTSRRKCRELLRLSNLEVRGFKSSYGTSYRH
jgi:uncharacterized protein YjiS (DUF1127 family)